MAERGYFSDGDDADRRRAGLCLGLRHPEKPNKEGAYAYLDAMLVKSAQEAFAVDMGYNPTVSNAVVAPDLNKRIGFTPDEIKKLVDLDYNYLNKNDLALKEWWDKELKG